jgi:hypothetical protein
VSRKLAVAIRGQNLLRKFFRVAESLEATRGYWLQERIQGSLRSRPKG